MYVKKCDFIFDRRLGRRRLTQTFTRGNIEMHKECSYPRVPGIIQISSLNFSFQLNFRY
jgi:hypothetical protein